MNERIKELYNQCFVELKNGTPNVGFDFEKFAQLIIRECAEVADDYTFDCEGMSFGLEEVLVKHFGVE